MRIKLRSLLSGDLSFCVFFTCRLLQRYEIILLLVLKSTLFVLIIMIKEKKKTFLKKKLNENLKEALLFGDVEKKYHLCGVK